MTTFLDRYNKRNKITPIVGKYFANHRKNVAFLNGLAHNIGSIRGEEASCVKKYRKRVADEILKRKLEGKGAVLIEGPKWCGKTTTAEQFSASVLYMDDPERKEQNITMSELNPRRLLNGAVPRLIDEWQLAPKLWDAIRFEVDHRGELGQFILTGSAVPVDTREITHSGTGRFTWLTMRPMSLYESGDSTGDVSLSELFTGKTEIDGESNLSIDRLAFLVCRGGWPQSVDMRDEIALDQAMDYYDAVVHADINRADNVQKNPERVRRLMRSYARNQGGQVPNTVIAQDIAANDETPISEETVASYVNALRKSLLWKICLHGILTCALRL